MAPQKILWIEDDYYNYQSLFRPLQLMGISLDYALSALEGYNKARKWRMYAAIVVDIILPLKMEVGEMPEVVKAWEKEQYPGIGLVKWLLAEEKVKIPVIILSVIDNPIQRYDLQDLGIADYIPKRGLLPSVVTQRILAAMEGEAAR